MTPGNSLGVFRGVQPLFRVPFCALAIGADQCQCIDPTASAVTWGEAVESPNRNARLFGFLVAAAIGVWLTINLLSASYWSLNSAHWPTTPGKVVSSSIESGTTTLGDWWAPAVKYDYAVGSANLRAETIRFYLPFLRDRAAAEAIRAPYPVGQFVTVSYDPENPAHAVLEPGLRQPMWKPTIAALLFWTVAAFLFYDINHPGALRARFRPASTKDESPDEDADERTENVA